MLCADDLQLDIWPPTSKTPHLSEYEASVGWPEKKAQKNQGLLSFIPGISCQSFWRSLPSELDATESNTQYSVAFLCTEHIPIHLNCVMILSMVASFFNFLVSVCSTCSPSAGQFLPPTSVVVVCSCAETVIFFLP